LYSYILNSSVCQAGLSLLLVVSSMTETARVRCCCGSHPHRYVGTTTQRRSGRDLAICSPSATSALRGARHLYLASGGGRLAHPRQVSSDAANTYSRRDTSGLPAINLSI
jgi:hypothetical protein